VPPIAVDFGGTTLRLACVSSDGRFERFRHLRLGGDAFSRDGAIWDFISATIAKYADEAPGAPSGTIVVSFPGPLDAAGDALAAPTVSGPGNRLPDFRRELAARTRRPVMMLNDVSAAAWYFAERFGAERFAVVTVSSGIGAKTFVRTSASPVIDDLPFAGELGHLVVDWGLEALACECGGRGHLGGIASGRGIERAARLAAARDPAEFGRSAPATQFGATLERLENEAHFVPALQLRDPWALGVLRKATAPLASVLCALSVGAGLQRIAIMGGFAQHAGHVYLEVLRACFDAALGAGPAHFDTSEFFYLADPAETPSLSGAAIFGRSRIATPR